MDIRQMQKEVYQNKLDKHFNTTNVNMEFNLLYGEVAEAYDAYNKNLQSLGEELADVAIYLMGLSEMLNIDLQNEVENKMKINKLRKYIKTADGKWTKIDPRDKQG